MNEMSETMTTSTDDDFETLLQESFISQDQLEGRVLHGTVVLIENDFALVDVGLKTEGRIPMREFTKSGEEIKVGDSVDVYLERIENALGDAMLSREKARREESWNHLEIAFERIQH